MTVCPPRFAAIAAVYLLSFLATAPAARALVLDWDSVAWTSGALSKSFDLNSDAVNDVTVAMTYTGSNPFTNDPATGTITPTINQSLTGGLAPVQNSLMLAGNLYTHSDVTAHLSFTGAQPGANNVSFTIFDIDVTTNSDIISSIYGVAPDGTHVAATITNVGSAVTLSGSGLSQTLTGNAANANNSGNGNVTISFGTALITDVFFTFSNNAGAPFYQDIALGDISFTPVPEINLAVASALSCLFAIGLTMLLRRRRKMELGSSAPRSA